jgi:murein DD-endopeptidase MepM/ murein hydrolase activator NlpD
MSRRPAHRAPLLRSSMVAGLLVVSGLVATPASTLASPMDSSDAAAEQAAAEIQAARDRANAAADAMFDAESALDTLTLDEQATALEVAELEAKASQLQVDVQEVAVQRFISGRPGIPLLGGLDGPTEQAQVDVLLSIITDTSQVSLDEYAAVADDLQDKRRQLAKAKERTAKAIEDYAALKVKAEAEVKKLQEIEAKRLADEKVRKILEAQRAAQQAAAAAAARAGSSGSFTVNTGAGNTGARRAGSAGFDENGFYFDGSIVCPVSGSTGFSDTWGAPRSGGRRHEGVDMMASTGTPLVAVVSGRVSFSVTSLGGLSAYVYGSNGNKYFYAHLSAWEGSNREVTQGDIIGYVGDSGNATGTPHLHFQVHPGGGRPVNPYPSVRAAC